MDLLFAGFIGSQRRAETVSRGTKAVFAALVRATDSGTITASKQPYSESSSAEGL